MKNKTSLASRLRHRIIIQTPVMVSDNVGGFTTTWVKFAQVWAEILPKNGDERLLDEKLLTQKRVIITIRYMAGVTEKMRIIYTDRKFNILSLCNPYEENILLEIMAEEKTEY